MIGDTTIALGRKSVCRAVSATRLNVCAAAFADRCLCRLRISVSDFDILERLGDGSFSTVVLATFKGDGQKYAVKIVNKTLVLRNKVRLCRPSICCCWILPCCFWHVAAAVMSASQAAVCLLGVSQHLLLWFWVADNLNLKGCAQAI